MFGHLQVYSSYSFQESTLLISDIVQAAKNESMPAVALTDKDNLYGIVEFYKACLKNEIKSILGLEASVLIDGEAYPFILLARDTQGYFYLCKDSTNAQLNGCVSLEDIDQQIDHLFILTPGNAGLIERLITKELYQEALRYLGMLHERWKDHFYINLHDHHKAMQRQLNEKLLSFASMLHVKVVCSNGVCYLRSEDALAYEMLKASKNSKTLPLDYQADNNQKYFKSEKEMRALFDENIIHETLNLIDECNAKIPMGELNLPKYPVPKNGDSYAYLRQLCIMGLKKRFKNQKVPKNYRDRLQEELDIIAKMKYCDYFLIVWDYVRYAKRQGILVGPGRGSAAGSLVSYVLGITNCDPIAFDLLFERFLNPERVSMPDIDIDFQDNRRDEVIEYVIQKYGQEHVAGIVTFSTYGPRIAIKDLGKVLNVPLAKLERLASMVPTDYKTKKSAYQMYQDSAAFSTMVDQDPAYRMMMPAVFLIERLPRNISQHAAGVILSESKLEDIVPLVNGPSDTLMCQYSKDHIEDVGLLKMDVRIVH